jgi:hypothetical protein
MIEFADIPVLMLLGIMLILAFFAAIWPLDKY